MKVRKFTFFFIFLFGVFISCNNNPAVHSLAKTEKKTSAEGSNKIVDTNKQKLSSILYELAIAPDHEHFAKKHNIQLDNNRVRVFISFEPSSSDTDRKKIFNDHGIIIEKTSADMVRGLVTVDHLISLSQEPVIRSIRLPDRLIKTRNNRP